MSRAYYRDLVSEPLAISNTSVTLTAATDTIIFQASQIAIQNSDVRPGKVWKLTATGLVTAAGGSWLITPRWGQLLTSPSLGQGGATINAPTVTNVVFILEIWAICRTLGLGGGANSSIVAMGRFTASAAAASTAAWVSPVGGGAAVTFDIATANICGLQVSINASVTAALGNQLVTLEALN